MFPVTSTVWGSDDPLTSIGLASAPDLILASDVVYGNDPEKWRQLVRTMCDLSGPHTLVVIGNVQRYPVHHPMAETKFFEEVGPCASLKVTSRPELQKRAVPTLEYSYVEVKSRFQDFYFKWAQD